MPSIPKVITCIASKFKSAIDAIPIDESKIKEVKFEFETSLNTENIKTKKKRRCKLNSLLREFNVPKDVVRFVTSEQDYDELNRNTLLSSDNKVNNTVVIDGSNLLDQVLFL